MNSNVKQEADFVRYWGALRRDAWAISGSAVAAGLIAALAVSAMTPVFRASVTILIESQPANVISIEEVYGLDTQTQQYFATQFEILNSRPLVENVVELMDLENNREFTAGAKSDWLGFNWREWFSRGAPEIDRSSKFEHVIEAYYDKLTIEPLRATQLVNLYFDSESPALAAEIANNHAEAYIQSMRGARAGFTDSAVAWMSERLDDLQKTLLESEQRLQAFREAEQLIDVEGLKALPAKEINELTMRLLQVRRELSQSRIAYSQAYSGDGRPLADLSGIPAILDDKGVQELQKVEAQAQLKVAELAKRYGPQHPQMIAARSELLESKGNLQDQRQSVAESIKNQFDAARSEEAELVTALNRAKQQYQEIGRKESELVALQREGDTNRNLYDLFYNRVSEAAITGDLETVPARIVSPAVVPTKPDKPKKVFVISLIIVLTLIGGTTVALLAEATNNTVRGVVDVEERLGLPVLGMVPLLSKRKKNRPSLGNVFFDRSEQKFNEAIRTVRTNISLDNMESPHRVIAVVSSASDEGKTIFVLNFAHAFGQSENVLLVEADMRCPSIGRELKLPGDRPGLSELLRGEAQLSECIFRGGKNRINVMLAGKTPPDAAQLLSSERMVNVLLVLRNHYDRIIIDTPPVLPISDALVISRQADSVVFVTKAEATSIRHIRQALDMLLRANARVSGVVVNQLDTRKAKKYSNYGYGGYYEEYGPGSLAS